MATSTIISLLFISIVWHTTSIDNSSTDNGGLRESHSDEDCFCYSKEESISCYCDEKIRFEVTLQSNEMRMSVTCVDDKSTDPYAHLSIVDARYFLNRLPANDTSLSLEFQGCPPPKRGYSALAIRLGDNAVSISEAVSRLRLAVKCGDLKQFHLESHHFSGLDNMRGLVLECPSLSDIPEHLLAGVSSDLTSVRILNTAVDSIPDRLFSSCSGLQKLIIRGNRLERMGSLERLNNLTSYEIVESGLSFLAEDVFYQNKEIIRLLIQDSLLSNLPESLCGLRKLEELNGRNNKIRFIRPGCLASLGSLRILSLGGNQLRVLDFLLSLGRTVETGFNDGDGNGAESTVDNLFLTTLSSKECSVFTGNRSTFLFPKANCFLRSTELREIDFRNNSLSSIQEYAFSQLKLVENIDLSFNHLSSLPPKLFSDNVGLLELRLANNLLANVPEGLLTNNVKLKLLDLSSNRIRTLGSNFFSGLTAVEKIDLSNNSIGALPYNIFFPFNATFNPSEAHSPLVLNLEGNLLEALPVLSLPRLVELNLARNRLSVLDVGTFKHVHLLQRLNLSLNTIQTAEHRRKVGGNMSTSIFQPNLRNIVAIDLSHNQLRRHPKLNLIAASLRSLNLSGNRIEDLPLTGMSLLSYFYRALEFLDLSRNALQKKLIPRVRDVSRIVSMEAVKHLDVSWNGIVILQCSENPAVLETTRCVTFLRLSKNLEVLIMSHNAIQVIPVYFASLPKLRRVDLRHNRIKRVLHEEFFSTHAVSELLLRTMREPLGDYLRDGEYYQLPDTHRLTIDLRYNDISNLDFPDEKVQLVPRNCEVERQFSRATMSLGHNPIVCGCQIFKLLQYSLKEIRPVEEEEAWRGNRRLLPVTLDIRGLTCGAPSTVLGKNVSEPETWAHHLLPLFGKCHVLQNP